MKRLVMKLMIALLVNVIVGGLIALAVGVAPWIGAVGLNVIAIAIGACLPKDVLRAGVFTEIWTGELVKSLRGGLEGSWLDGVPDQSSIVDNDVIHLVDVGVDPDVLIDNTTYPIPLQALDDADIPVKLSKFQTKVTPITDDELYAASYDKIARVKEGHSNSINDGKFTKAAHALCAQKNTAKTPVLTTTGERDAETGRLRLSPNDLVAMKKALDKLLVPSSNRRLVLCPDHVNDLLLASQNFREQYNIDRATGKVGKLYGFDIFEYANTPLYTKGGVKKNLGTTADEGEFQCSFAFHTPRVFKATGSTKMYYSEATTDPQNQRSLINFRHYFLCMPKKTDAGVVIVSGYKKNP